MRSPALRLARGVYGNVQTRNYSAIGSSKIRHFLSMSDFSGDEITRLVQNAAAHKKTVKSGNTPKGLSTGLAGKTVAMMFNKRSTRTRVSTEAAVTLMGGHPMFLGKDDIQLGVNESLYDTSKVISSMTSCMVARVGPHTDVADLAEHSSVPVINALSDSFHPLQTIADLLTIHESVQASGSSPEFLPRGLKVAWVGDSNNVLFDLAIACVKLGINISVASPRGYEIPQAMEGLINSAVKGAISPGMFEKTLEPGTAVKDADFLVTDTWVSMGQEAETKRRLKDFEGFQITSELAERGGAKKNWSFMHCLPRHPEEVSDEVFYGPRSLVFPEAENRLWAALAVLEAFVVNKGKIVD